MTEPTFCAGMAEIAGHYDGLIVDQWGVLHNGSEPYPAAIECLERLRAANKRVVLLSNSGRRVAFNRQRLESMRFSDRLFDAVVTSGEAAWRALRDRADPFFAGLGPRCLLWAEGGDRSVAEGLDVELVGRVEDADFIFLVGTDKGSTLADFEPDLQAALARGLPMVCSNPDIIVVTAQGTVMAPGAVAQRYAALGGRVAYTGKPHAPIYRLCREFLAPLPTGAILAVGDSLEHDVAGGAAAGLETALVMGGIHAPSFDLQGGEAGNGPALERLTRQHGATPRWVLPAFRWAPA